MNRLIVILCLVCASLSLSAQKKFYFGLKAGLNLSTLKPDNVTKESLKTGFMGGAFFKIRPIKEFAIQPEFLWVNKGSEITWDAPNQPGGKFALNMDYVDVPVLAVVHFSEKFDVHVGPQFSYLVNFSVMNLEESGYDFEGNIDQRDYKPYDFAGVAGAEITLKKVQIGARYNAGLIDLQKSDSGSEIELTKPKNASTQIYLGLIF